VSALEVTVVINPIAGRGAGLRARPVIAAVLQDAGMQVVEAIADAPGQAEGHAERAARERRDIVVAVGGDGTLHEVVNGLMRGRPDQPPALAVVPAGTANIFARALHLPKDLEAAARLIVNGARQRIDLGQVNGRYFATVAGMGFDAELARIAARWPRWINGKARHVLAGLLRLPTYRAVDANIQMNGRQWTERIFLLAAANTDWYGGGIHLAPHARIDDGRLAVVYIRAINPLRVVELFLKTLSGRHLHHPRVGFADAERIHVASDIPLPVHADGEDVGTTPVDILCIPDALEVFIPNEG
jgi:diacylglycerol kinase (ATP)